MKEAIIFSIVLIGVALYAAYEDHGNKERIKELETTIALKDSTIQKLNVWKLQKHMHQKYPSVTFAEPELFTGEQLFQKELIFNQHQQMDFRWVVVGYEYELK